MVSLLKLVLMTLSQNKQVKFQEEEKGGELSSQSLKIAHKSPNYNIHSITKGRCGLVHHLSYPKYSCNF